MTDNQTLPPGVPPMKRQQKKNTIQGKIYKKITGKRLWGRKGYRDIWRNKIIMFYFSPKFSSHVLG